MELPSTHRIPLAWLLEHGSEAIRYRTLTERVYIGEGSTLKLKQSLEKLAPGETSAPPPAPPKQERRRSRDHRDDPGYDDRDDGGR